MCSYKKHHARNIWRAFFGKQKTKKTDEQRTRGTMSTIRQRRRGFSSEFKFHFPQHATLQNNPISSDKKKQRETKGTKKIEKKESNKGERETKQWEALFQPRSGRNNVRPWRNGHGNKQKIAKKYSRGLRAWLKYHEKIYSPGIIRVFTELSQRRRRIL